MVGRCNQRSTLDGGSESGREFSAREVRELARLELKMIFLFYGEEVLDEVPCENEKTRTVDEATGGRYLKSGDKLSTSSYKVMLTDKFAVLPHVSRLRRTN